MLRDQAGALVLAANDRDGYLPLAGTLVVNGNPSLPALAPLVGDAARRRYSYLLNPFDTSRFGGQNLAPLPLAIADASGSLGEPLPATQADLTEWVGSQRAQGVLEPWLCPSRSQPGVVAVSVETLALRTPTSTIVYLHQVPNAYAFNEGIFGFAYNDQTRRLRGKLSRVQGTSEVVLLGDDDDRQGPAAPNVSAWVPALDAPASGITLADVLAGTPTVSPGSGVAFERHDGRINLLLADGHVATTPREPLEEGSFRLSPR